MKGPSSFPNSFVLGVSIFCLLIFLWIIVLDMIDWKPYVYLITRVADRKDRIAKYDDLLFTRLDRLEEKLSKLDPQVDVKVESIEGRLASLEAKLDKVLSLLTKSS